MTTAAVLLPVLATGAGAQDIPYRTGDWNADSLGNHRVVVEVPDAAGAVWTHIPWRRRDLEPERKHLVVLEAATNAPIANVARVNVNREFGDLVFEAPRAGRYYVYYLPNVVSGRSNYPTVTYPAPESTADAAWLDRHGLREGSARSMLEALPAGRVVAFESIDQLNSFFPMEVIATASETDSLLAAHGDRAYLVFPEDRRYPVRMYDDLPRRWIESGPLSQLTGTAMRGEFYAFQLAIFAARSAVELHQVDFTALDAGADRREISSSAFRCFNLEGVDWTGRPFSNTVSVPRGKIQPLWCGVQIPEDAAPGRYRATATLVARDLPSTSVVIDLSVSSEAIAAAGDDEPWRHSRLRWLDSRIAFDDEVVRPYLPVGMNGDTLFVLGRRIELARSGLPARIRSFFAPEMTHVHDAGRDVLTGPVELVVDDMDGQPLEVTTSSVRKVRQAAGVAGWEATNRAGPLTMQLEGEIEFDGTMEFVVRVSAERRTAVGDIRLRIPYARDVAKYMMGMGYKGGYRPDAFEWSWDVERNQDGAWLGDVNAGMQFSMRDENYARPLNTNFYLSKPLVMPTSWDNDGRGGCRMREESDDAFLVACHSGARTIAVGDTLFYNFRLAVTPFRPIDTRSQWGTRFFHRFETVDSIRSLGANTINVHHATDINPYINYPFLRPAEMKAYVDEAHAKGMKVKIYYTVRELTNRAPELFALRSLGDEILSYGPGGGFSWLQEHLGGNYIAAWFVPRLKDAAVINSGVSRWHNYYLEGLNWLVRNVGIDGLYIDDVAFDRTTMKRVRKILDRGGPGKLIDLHSANQFNPRDGFANSANLYLEHFPFIDRLWFGEYFDYDSPPEFWMTEVSGIPFGLMGEMLQDGGNPWRGMLYGMTTRLPWAGDPSPLWKLWDEFGIEDSRMIGYWVPDAPVTTDHERVLATSYLADGKALISIASWADAPVDVTLSFDWARLGVDRSRARLVAPWVTDFQDERTFDVTAPVSVPPGKGWLLVLDERPDVLRDPDHEEWRTRAPDVFRARFTTTKGDFVVEVQRDWAPIGVDRFYNLVRLGFYDDMYINRVRAGFIAQFGINGDPAVTAAWDGRTISDDPVRASNMRGTIAYAMTGPDTRLTQVYINYDDSNSRLDAQGFAPFGRVVEGMDVVDRLYAEYDESAGGGMRGGKQGRILREGNAHLRRDYPKLDYIRRAVVVQR